jgi:hypothetical protein
MGFIVNLPKKKTVYNSGCKKRNALRNTVDIVEE